MAAILTFTTKFNLMTNPKKFVFIDTTNYPAQTPAIATVNVVGNVTITSPSGIVIHTNTNFGATPNVLCDIDINVSATNQNVISLPLTSAGLVEPGVYTILYTVYDNNLSVYYTATNTYTYSYISPEVEITQTVDCLSPIFTSVDSTDYTVDSIVPTKTLVHTIDYPYGSAGESTPTIGSGTTVTTSTFYQGTQTTEISATLTYTYSDGLIVLDLITGALEVLVDCKDVCGIYCCIRSIEQQMNDYKTSNRTEYPKYVTLFSEIMGYVSLALLAIRCGKSDDVNGFLATLRLLSKCTEDCSCSGTTPSQVTGLGGLVNSYVVNSCGSPVTVTPVTVGNVTTYTVCLDPAFVASVNSFYNTVVAAGNNVTVTPVTVGLTTTYTIAAEEAVVAAGANVTVTPSGPVAGVMTYTVAATQVPDILYNNIANVSTTDGAAGAFESLQTYVLPLNTLSTNGDSLEILSTLSVDVETSISAVRLYINGASVVPVPPSSFLLWAGTKICQFRATISRQSATTAFIQFDVKFAGGANFTSTGSSQLFATGVAVNDFTTLANTIAIYGAETPAANTLTAHNMLIIKHKI